MRLHFWCHPYFGELNALSFADTSISGVNQTEDPLPEYLPTKGIGAMWRRHEARETRKIDRVRTSNVTLQLRSVALFEAAKAILILLLACGAFDLIHKNLDAVAEQIALMLRIRPAGRLSHVFVKLVTHVNDRTLPAVAAWALFDGAMRSVAAYGLWQEREWAQWFELLSSALYLPPEMYLLLHRPSWLRGSVLAMNIIIVLMMLRLSLNTVCLQQIQPTQRSGEARLD